MTRALFLLVTGLVMAAGSCWAQESVSTDASISLALPAEAPAGAGSLTSVNLSGLEDAESYALNVIEQYEKENPREPGVDPKSREPLVLLHLGNEVPSSLQWVMVRLDRAEVPFRLELVTEKNLEQSLDKAREEGLDLVAFEQEPSVDRGTATKRVESIWRKSKLTLKQIFGLPNGLTLWVKLNRKSEEKRKEFKMASTQAAIASVSLWLTFFVSDPSIAFSSDAYRTIAAFSAWVWAFSYWARPIGEVMTQGRVVKEVSSGDWRVVKGNAFFWSASFVRSFLTNSIILAGVFGPEYVISAAGIATSSLNSLTNLFARSWVDKWIYDKQAATRKSGDVVRENGQHSAQTTIRLNFWWNFLYGGLKNVALLGLNNGATILYGTMGAIGVSKQLWEDRMMLKRGFSKMASKVGLGKTIEAQRPLSDLLSELRPCHALFR